MSTSRKRRTRRKQRRHRPAPDMTGAPGPSEPAASLSAATGAPDPPSVVGASVIDAAAGPEPIDVADLACVICGDRNRVRAFHMTHGVVVVLCDTHRADRYLRRGGGRAFTDRLERIWRAHGMATAARLGALRTHRRRCTPPDRSRCPGSYSWPGLRAEAEGRFARGDDPDAVIGELRVRHADDHATAPSVQTMRRWFREARWLDDDARRPGSRVAGRRRGRRRTAMVRSHRGASPSAPKRTWYTPSGKPPWPFRYASLPGMSMDFLHPWGAIFFDMSRREPDEDDFGTRWIHGSA